MPLYLASNALTLMSDLFVDSILRTSCALFPQTMQTRSAGCRFFVLREFYTFLSHAVATMIHGCISLSSWCLLVVVCLFLAVPWGCLLFVIVVFPDRAHILFLGTLPPAYLSCEFAFHVRFQRIVRALSLNCV